MNILCIFKNRISEQVQIIEPRMVVTAMSLHEQGLLLEAKKETPQELNLAPFFFMIELRGYFKS